MAINADQRLYFALVYPLVACGDDQHSLVIGSTLENNTFRNLANKHTERVCSLLRRASGAVQHQRLVAMACRPQKGRHFLGAL